MSLGQRVELEVLGQVALPIDLDVGQRAVIFRAVRGNEALVAWGPRFHEYWSLGGQIKLLEFQRRLSVFLGDVDCGRRSLHLGFPLEAFGFDHDGKLIIDLRFVFEVFGLAANG